MNDSLQLRQAKEAVQALSAEDRSALRNWIAASYDINGVPLSRGPLDVGEWKAYLQAAQSLQAFFESAQAFVYHWDRRGANGSSEHDRDLSRTSAAIMLLYDTGGVIMRMHEKHPQRRTVATYAAKYRAYLHILGFDPNRMPGRNDLLQRKRVEE